MEVIGKKSAESPCNPRHYSRWAIEPWDFIAKNNLDFMRGNVIKYLMRHDMKNGLEDLLKARVYLDRIIENYQEDNAEDSVQTDNIQRMWEASLYNITDKDNAILNAHAFNVKTHAQSIYIIRHEAGFFIVVDKDVEYPAGLSDQFYALVKHARENSYHWINLDRDAEPAPGFDFAEW